VGLSTVVVLVALLGPVGSVSLLDGPLLTIVIELVAVGVVMGVTGRPRQWWMTWGAAIAAGAALVVVFLWWSVGATGLVDQHYPPTFLLWVWGALVAAGIAVTGWWDGTVIRRTIRVLTVPVAVFAAFLLINEHYGYWPTVGALLGRPAPGQVSSRALARTLASPKLSSSIGEFGPIKIPGPAGFAPGAAWAWIPPAFDRVDRADLPVLVMLPGVPGTPYDWERAGEVVSLANAWAQTHDGVAPVMILVTGNGASDRDTECVNGPQGDAETYLADAVPHFVTHTLGIPIDPARWGVVGFSEGGTCALGLATEHPQIFGRFVDIAGDMAPNLGPNARSTLVRLYAGNKVAMLDHEPRWLLAHRSYPDTEGWFAGSSKDRTDERVARALTRLARAGGMTVFNVSGGAGGHSWTYAAAKFRSLYPALVNSMSAPIPPRPDHPDRRIFIAGPGHSPRQHHDKT
jgi:S-formylglutathione hydrolase FrmB